MQTSSHVRGTASTMSRSKYSGGLFVQGHRFKTIAEAKATIQEYIEIFTTANVGIHDLAMSARRSLTRGIGELLRLLDPGLSDLVRTPQHGIGRNPWHYR